MASKNVHKNEKIQVVVRCRALNASEVESGQLNVVECTRDGKNVCVKEKNSLSSKKYTFDRVFGPHAKQVELYQTVVVPMVNEVLSGYNCTIFAYGQTGTGKTYTMIGERSDELKYSWETDPTTGIIPRTLSHLFSKLNEMSAEQECEYSVRVSFMELYNEELFDLLAVNDTQDRLAIYDDVSRKGSVIVKGLQEVGVLTKEDVYEVIERGVARRQTACTQLNAHSSRSHSVFTVTVHIKESTITGEELVKTGKLNLVDLAGSENIGRSGAIEKRAREAGSINQSLLTLGRIITALVDKKSHIPYRESKLTRILQDSLGGKTKTCIVATITPSSGSLEETLSTLDYAHRAKDIQNRPEVNQKMSQKTLIKEYTEEMERLRKDLLASREKNGVYMDKVNYDKILLTIDQQRDKIRDLEDRKDLLTEDLKTSTEMYSLSQQELSDCREAKESVETELSAYEQLLDDFKVKLLETEKERRQEKFLKEAHQKTEVELGKQACDLISTVTQSIGDVEGLHAKVSRQVAVEQTHLDRVATFSQISGNRVTSLLTEMEGIKSGVVGSCSEMIAAIDKRCERDQTFLQHTETFLGHIETRFASELAALNDARTAQDLEREARLSSLGTRIESSSISMVRDSNAFETQDLEKRVADLAKFRGDVIAVLDKMTTDADSIQKTTQTSLSNLSHNLCSEFDRVSKHITEFVADQTAIVTSLINELTEMNIREQKHAKEREDKITSMISSASGMTSAYSSLITGHSELVSSCLSSVSSQFTDLNTHIASAQTLRQETLTSAHALVEAEASLDNGFCASLGDCLSNLSTQANELATSSQADMSRETDAMKSDREAAFNTTSDILAQVSSQCAELSASLKVQRQEVKSVASHLTDLATSIGTTCSDQVQGVTKALHTVDESAQHLAQKEIKPCPITGATPIRREFVYPQRLTATSPQKQLLSRFQTALLPGSVERVLPPPLPSHIQELRARRLESAMDHQEEVSGASKGKSGTIQSSGVGSVASSIMEEDDPENTIIVDTTVTNGNKYSARPRIDVSTPTPKRPLRENNN